MVAMLMAGDYNVGCLLNRFITESAKCLLGVGYNLSTIIGRDQKRRVPKPFDLHDKTSLFNYSDFPSAKAKARLVRVLTATPVAPFAR